MLAPGGMAKGQDDFENDRIVQRGSRCVEPTLDHHPLSEIPGCEFAIDLKMAHADVGDLVLLEEPMAHHVASRLVVRGGE